MQTIDDSTHLKSMYCIIDDLWDITPVVQDILKAIIHKSCTTGAGKYKIGLNRRFTPFKLLTITQCSTNKIIWYAHISNKGIQLPNKHFWDIAHDGVELEMAGAGLQPVILWQDPNIFAKTGLDKYF